VRGVCKKFKNKSVTGFRERLRPYMHETSSSKIVDKTSQAPPLKNCSKAHRSWSRQMFGDAKNFCPNFPKLARKNILLDFCLQNLSHKDHRGFFQCDFQKQSLPVLFLQTLGTIFTRIFWDFARIFNKSKPLLVRLHPRLLHHCIIMKIKNTSTKTLLYNLQY